MGSDRNFDEMPRRNREAQPETPMENMFFLPSLGRMIPETSRGLSVVEVARDLVVESSPEGEMSVVDCQRPHVSLVQVTTGLVRLVSK